VKEEVEVKVGDVPTGRVGLVAADAMLEVTGASRA
jgi:hypothetical protein